MPIGPEDVFRERLLALTNLPYREFAKVVYGKPCPDLLHIEDYMRGKFEKFTEDPLGLILSLDSVNFQRVYEFLHAEPQ